MVDAYRIAQDLINSKLGIDSKNINMTDSKNTFKSIVYKGYDLTKVVNLKLDYITEFGRLRETSKDCLLYYCKDKKRWTMISAKTGIHQLFEDSRLNKRVRNHWQGFKANQD